MTRTAEVIICGAGMAGLAAAYQLAVRMKVARVVLIEEGAPLGMTSSKGTEAYRNWWPSSTMVRFMNRSIDLLEELDAASGHAFELNRRGYTFLTAREDEAARMRETSATIAALGAASDFTDDPDAIRARFPFIAPGARAMLHVQRAGWMNAKKLGAWLLERALAQGVELVRERAIGIEESNGRFRAVVLASGAKIEARAFVLAAGPLLPEWSERLALGIPIVNELHGKVAFEDTAGIIPREVPMLIWNDAADLGPLGRFAPGVHFRVRGEKTVLGIWTWNPRVETPAFPPHFDASYADIMIRGLACMVPGLARYIDANEAKQAIVDGGYYCKTPDNRPLIGPAPIDGVFLIGALSGFGVMASQAAADIVAAHVCNLPLPDEARAFRLERFRDPDYRVVSTRDGEL